MVNLRGRRRKFKMNKINGPNGIRTRVFDVRGRCPRPLDDGTFFKRSILSDQLAIIS